MDPVEPVMDPVEPEAEAPCCCCGVGMKLRCFERNSGANSYYLLDNLGADKDSSTEKQEELQFFDDNGTFVTVVVEKNLRAIDLTLLLAVKNRVRKDFCWSIIEHWVELGTERVLEDHEDVLSIYRQTESAAKKYIFRRFQSKYDFFTAPESYFPPDMIDLKTYVSGCLASENYVEEISEEDFPLEFERVLMTAEELPVIFSQVNLRHKTEKRHWEKTFLLLKGSKVYMSSKVRVVAKFLRAWKNATGYKKLGSQSSVSKTCSKI
ncbi:hypothetical protein GE061_007887 [Apolygus lucorum]|uniref:Ras-associating domain-containing protein n=1 Tax=Apolygus lucorum TaxID=248454 RepID=A0A8S9WM20_APOLU|nr:hypothetical protein GE061_007887 [Apolygus lucorum]